MEQKLSDFINLNFCSVSEQKFPQNNCYVINKFLRKFEMQRQELSQFTELQSNFEECLKMDINGLTEHNLQLFYILNTQNLVIQKLLENQKMLRQKIQEARRYETTDTENNYPSERGDGSENSTDGEERNRVVRNIITKSSGNSALFQDLDEDKSSKPQISLVYNTFSEAYSSPLKMEHEESEREEKEAKKVCETKNIIKNYGKSILTFIRKNAQLTKKVLEEYGVDENDFFEELQFFKCRVNSITDLKLFWTSKGNKFDKVFRVLSNIYLRKHSLKHTFCSRVRNHSVHIKYRKRLLEVLESPESFNSIKYF